MGKYVTKYVKEHYREVKVKREVYERLSEIAGLLGVSNSSLIELLVDVASESVSSDTSAMPTVDFKFNISEEVREKLYKIKPRTVAYLFSAGKDSSLALLLTRDFIRDFCRETGCRVYMLHVIIPGNTHPLNTFAASAVMEWHRKHYGFEPVYKCYAGNDHSHVFQVYASKYGLQTGPGRWCFVMFKDRVFRDFERTHPRQQLHIDGMSPSDSKHRSFMVSSELQFITTQDNTQYWAWHPLFNVNLDGDAKLQVLSRYEEFKPVVELYREFGDSLNCVLCPYKPVGKMLVHHRVEDLKTLYYFARVCLKSERWKRAFSKLMQRKLHET